MNDRRGSALLITTGLLAVLLLVAASVLSMTYTESFIAAHHAKNLQAWYLAEAGVEKAKAMLEHDSTLLDQGQYDCDIGLSSGKLQGTTHVTVIPPEINGSILVRSRALLTNGARQTLEVKYSASPWYVLYCDKIKINQPVDVAAVMNGCGVEIPSGIEIPDELTGEVVLAPDSAVAYQSCSGDESIFIRHTHRYKSPVVDLPFYRKLGVFEGDISWHGYNYDFHEDNAVRSGSMSGRILAAGQDLIIYTLDGDLIMDDVLLMAGRDIWIINLGSSPTEINGKLLAGRDIHIYQLDDELVLEGAAAASGSVNLYAAGGDIRLSHDPGSEVGFSAVLQGKTGFLSVESIKEVY